MHSHLLLGLISILILTARFQAGNLQAVEALVCTDPTRLEIGAGQIETMKILLINADKIYGIDLQATFDPAVVEVVDADPGQTGVQMLSGAFLKPDFVVRNQVDNTTGKLRYVITQLKPTPSATGRGIVLKVDFLGKTQGTSSRLTFTSAVIADRRGNKLAVTTQGADLVVIPPNPPTPTPHPTHTPHPTNTTRPPAPGSPTASLPPGGAQPTTQPSPTATRMIAALPPDDNAVENIPLAQSGGTIPVVDPGRAPGINPVMSDRLLTYITVGGFAGAVLFLGLTAGLLAAKRRKARSSRSK